MLRFHLRNKSAVKRITAALAFKSASESLRRATTQNVTFDLRIKYIPPKPNLLNGEPLVNPEGYILSLLDL